MIKFKEIRNKSEAELNKMLKEGREKIRDLRFRISQRQYKDVRQYRKTKRLISQLLTLMNNKKNKQ